MWTLQNILWWAIIDSYKRHYLNNRICSKIRPFSSDIHGDNMLSESPSENLTLRFFIFCFTDHFKVSKYNNTHWYNLYTKPYIFLTITTLLFYCNMTKIKIRRKKTKKVKSFVYITEMFTPSILKGRLFNLKKL